MGSWGSFCAYCGHEITGDFPRTCAHGHVTYLTGYSVGVALQPVLLQSTIYLLVVQRAIPPFVGHYALPGGFVDNDETPRQAAIRELREETGFVHDADCASETIWQAVGSLHRSGQDPRLPMLQFETMPLIGFEQVDLSYKTSETQSLMMVSYQTDIDRLTDIDGRPLDLCFPLHDEAAKRFLKRGDPGPGPG